MIMSYELSLARDLGERFAPLSRRRIASLRWYGVSFGFHPELSRALARFRYSLVRGALYRSGDLGSRVREPRPVWVVPRRQRDV
jgi:hypothetical protein